MIYQSSHLGHQAPTMSSSNKTSPRPRHKQTLVNSAKNNTTSKCGKRDTDRNVVNSNATDSRCRGRCRVQWSEQHVKEGLVLVQEAQLARVVKNGPIAEHYEIDPKPFASGQWAKVYKCRSRSSGTVYAAKYSSRNRFNADCSAELRHEIALLSLCSQSPRVVRLHDVYETPKEIILVMEYAPGGDLQTLIDGDLVPLEGDVVHFVRQLVEGLVYLHERNIAHLDIKPQNLVMMGSFPDCDVKLCDFEISRVVLEGAEVREILGTPDYVAPEILHYDPITLKADMWSLGVTTFVLLTGFSPFGGETDQETFKNILLGNVDFPEELFDDVSAQARDFVAKLLVLEPSARMSAKQCLRHDWLRGAPTQASAHLRKYLSKSREVLLERVVSRENLRRAALLSQTNYKQQQNGATPRNETLQWNNNLSQSEMCLSRGLNGSRGSLSLPGSGSDGYESPLLDTNSSRTSLADSYSSKSSLAMSQSCLLNKEQTQGLLSQARDRRSLRASVAHGLNRISLLSRMRSLSHIQSRSQACLPSLNGCSAADSERENRQVICGALDSEFDGSLEKLYGLKSLSKSQGMLDIYRSLESLKRRKRDLQKQQQRARTEEMLPFFKHNHPDRQHESKPSPLTASPPENGQDKSDEEDQTEDPIPADDINVQEDSPSTDDQHEENEEDVVSAETDDHDHIQIKDVEIADSKSPGPDSLSVSETNLDSLQSLESDTLTDDSQETSRSHPTKRSTASDGHSRDTDSENDEPKYSVAQLVQAFNKHQEVASKTSLESIMSEKRINDVTNFPIGPKALRLFIPDISITERPPLVRRKTSYKPRKNWEELRKKNEKNEGVLKKDFFNDSGNEDDAEEINEEEVPSKKAPVSQSSGGEHDTRIDEKYKQCVQGAKASDPCEGKKCSSESKKISCAKNSSSEQSSKPPPPPPPLSPSSTDSGVNLKAILQKVESFENVPKENLEKLRERTSIAKFIVNDSHSYLQDGNSTTKVTPVSRTRKTSLGNPTEDRKEIGISENSTTDHVDGKVSRLPSDERRLCREKICTGSYVRAMEKFNGKSIPEAKYVFGSQQTRLVQSERGSDKSRTRRKSTPTIPQLVDS